MSSSGTCGDNLTWTLDDSNNLVISGSGTTMDDYTSAGPWGTAIVSVTFDTTALTNIGAAAFRDCSKLVSVTLPSSVRTIGSSAFLGDRLLESIDLSGVETIGGYGVANCTKLSSVTFSEKLTSVGGSAFQMCGLVTVTIPASLKKIPSEMFYGNASLTTVTLNRWVEGDTNPITSLNATSAFTKCTSLAKIIVPKGSLEAYQTASNWSTFKDYMTVLVTYEPRVLVTSAESKNLLDPDTITSAQVFVPVEYGKYYCLSFDRTLGFRFDSSLMWCVGEDKKTSYGGTVSPEHNYTDSSYCRIYVNNENARYITTVFRKDTVSPTADLIKTSDMMVEECESLDSTPSEYEPYGTIVTPRVLVTTEGGSRLPDGLQEVEYIQNGTVDYETGKYSILTYTDAHLDTGVAVSSVARVEQWVRFVGSVKGIGKSANSGNIFLRQGGSAYISVTVNGMAMATSAGKISNVVAEIGDGTTYFTDLKSFDCSLTGTGNVQIGTWTDTVWSGVNQYHEMLLYDSSGNLLADLVPCYQTSDTTKAGCMYDLVSKTLKTNQGTGAYTVGVDVNASKTVYRLVIA